MQRSVRAAHLSFHRRRLMVDFLAEDSNDFLGLSCGRAHVAQLCDELRASGYSCSWAGHALESDSHGGAVAYLLHGLDAGCWRSSGSRWRSGSGVVGWGLRLSLGGIWRQQVFGGELRVVVGRAHARLHLLQREAHAAQLGDGLPPQGQGEGAAGDGGGQGATCSMVSNGSLVLEVGGGVEAHSIGGCGGDSMGG